MELDERRRWSVVVHLEDDYAFVYASGIRFKYQAKKIAKRKNKEVRNDKEG